MIIPPEKGKGGIFVPADLLYYIRNKLMKPYLPMMIIDPIWFREETKKKSRRFVIFPVFRSAKKILAGFL